MGIEIVNFKGIEKAYVKITSVEINMLSKVVKCSYIVYLSYESRINPKYNFTVKETIVFNCQYFTKNSQDDAYKSIDVKGIGKRIDELKDKNRTEKNKLKKLEINKHLGIEMSSLGRVKLNIFFNALQNKSIYQVLYNYLKTDNQFILAKDKK